MEFLPIIIQIMFGVALGLIPANIAKKKGYNFWGWWIYGAIFFLIALVHALCITDNSDAEQDTRTEKQDAHTAKQDVATYSGQSASDASAAEEIKKYKELYDAGMITKEEYNAKKKQLRS